MPTSAKTSMTKDYGVLMIKTFPGSVCLGVVEILYMYLEYFSLSSFFFASRKNPRNEKKISMKHILITLEKQVFLFPFAMK